MNEKIEKLLTTLAEKFGTTVSHLYEVLVKQQYVEAIKSLVYVFVVALLGLPAKLWLCHSIDMIPSHNDMVRAGTTEWPKETVMMVASSCTVTGVLIIYLVVNIFEAIEKCLDGFMNPEGAVVEKILEMLDK